MDYITEITITTTCRVQRIIEAATAEDLATTLKDHLQDCVTLTPADATIAHRSAHLTRVCPVTAITDEPVGY